MIEVGRDGDEAFGGEAVDDILDVLHEAPPLLNDDHGRTVAAGGAAK